MPDTIPSAPATLPITVDAVREFTGYTATTDATDPQVERCIKQATDTFRNDIAVLHHNERAKGELDGVNATFSVENVVFAYDLNDEATAIRFITVEYAGVNPLITTHTIASIAPLDGRFTLSAAPDADQDEARVTYWGTQSPIPESLVESAVLLLAAHNLTGLTRKSGRTLVANPNASTQDKPTESRLGRNFIKEYDDLVRAYRVKKPRSVPFQNSWRRL